MTGQTSSQEDIARVKRFSGSHRHADGHVCWYEPVSKDSFTTGFIVSGTGIGVSAQKCLSPHHDWDEQDPFAAKTLTEEEKLWDE